MAFGREGDLYVSDHGLEVGTGEVARMNLNCDRHRHETAHS